VRARLLSPLGDGTTLWHRDGIIEVDERGRIAWLGPAMAWERWAGDRVRASPSGAGRREPTDLRPLIILPGLVDLHVHLPQVPSAGLGAGLDLLTWLERHVFPVEAGFDRAAADRMAPAVYRAMAGAGTTAFAGYGAIWPDSLDACFAAAEAHGIRATIGKVMMDRLSYDHALPAERILDISLAQSAELCERWHGADGGRLRYAFTPRFAVSCSATMLRESAALARHHGATWQTHLAEDRAEIARVGELFPDARDYLDVYDRAGALGPSALLAHATHLSQREVDRLAESGSAVAHCPASNLFLASGIMPLARYLKAGIRVGLGSDVAGSPELSMWTQARTGFYLQSASQAVAGDSHDRLDVLGWLRLATLEGARALGLGEVIGSLEVGKDADLICVDESLALPPGAEPGDEPEAIVSRLVFRERPEMVRGAWVRGRRLEGPDVASGTMAAVGSAAGTR
jgi:guanine deaminase